MIEVDMKFPQCEKMKAVSEDSQKIGEFINWLSENDHQICVYNNDRFQAGFYPIHKTIEQLLAEYFEIDLVALEKERRVILNELQTANKKYF